MEFIVELLLEVFLELFFTLFAEGIGALVRYIDSDDKLKRNLKSIFTYSLLGLTILLIIISLSYSKTFLATIAISYMLLVLLITLLKWINNDKFQSKKMNIFISIFKRIVHYSYPILLIVLSAIKLTDAKALVSIIVISSIDIIIWFSIDMYKLWKREPKSKYNYDKYKNTSY
jgi:hypothetical protein